MRGRTRDFGTSIATHRKVTDEIRQRFPATVELAWPRCSSRSDRDAARVLRREEVRGLFDHASLFVSLIGISIPVFFLAIILKYIFAVQSRLVTHGGAPDRC